MTPVWVQRGSDEFEALQRYISVGIWGDQRDIPGDTIIASISSGNAVLGAAIFQNYNKSAGTIEISAAADSAKWLCRSVLDEMFSYPFTQLGCQAVLTRCDPDDKRLSRIFKAFGFKRYDIPRLRGRNKAEAIYVLGDDDWLGNGFHKEAPQ
ncbi:MAG: GNAT family protein [Sulfitobacter sp.]